MKFSLLPLCELATIRYGKNQSQVVCEKSEYPIYGTGGLMGYATRPLYTKPSVLIGRKGTIGRVKYVNHPFWTVDTLFYTEINELKVLPHYLYYVMSRLDLNAYNEGTTIPSLRTGTLNRLEFNIPSLEYQKKVLSVLEPLDKRIELNNAINNNLQQQTEALFAEYFLSFTDIPLGWRKGSLLDIAEYNNGLAMQKFRPKEGELGLPVLKIKELRQGFCDVDSELCSPSIRSDYIVHDGDVIFSWSGSLLVDFWCGGDCGLNQHLFKVTSSHYEPWFYYLWTNYHLAKFVAIAADKATTMGHIKREDLAKSEVLIPSADDYKKIGAAMRPLLTMLINNRIESKQLAGIRDSLLPKLMNGKIDISKVEI